MDELDEMIAILEAIQKHRREISLLVKRAQTMCPVLMDWQGTWQDRRVRELLTSQMLSNHYDTDKALAEQIQEYRGRKAIVKAVQEQPDA